MIWPARNYECKKMDKTNSVQPPLKSSSLWVTLYMIHYDAGHPVQCTWSNMMWDTLYSVHMYTVYEGSSNNVTNSQFKNNFIDIKTFLSNSATSRYSQWQPLKNKLTFARMFVYCLHLNLNTFTISFIAFFFFERGKKIL